MTSRVVGQAEIVVRAEIDDPLRPGRFDPGVLRRRQHALGLVEAGLADLPNFAAQMFEKSIGHDCCSATFHAAPRRSYARDFSNTWRRRKSSSLKP